MYFNTEHVRAAVTAMGLILTFALGGMFQPVAFADEATTVVDDIKTNEEMLWFARTLYSESKVPEEQLLVAWVIRNRVESEQYPDTYKETVLQRGQFSGLHPSDKQYRINVSFTFEHTGPGWDSAVEIAHAVYTAPGILRPFPKTVRHFYSPQSVTVHPSWAVNEKPVHTIRNTETEQIRFAFYDSI